MPKDTDKAQPFDQDVQTLGGYQYTGNNKLSAMIANARFTAEILGATDFREKSVVDIGCGDGKYTHELLIKGGAKHILGIDPAEKAIALARAKYASDPSISLVFNNATSDRLVNSGEKFDIAVLRGVVHHASMPMEEIKNALKLVNKVIILEPNGLNPVVKFLEKFSTYHVGHQERSFPLSQITNWIESSGGRLVYAKYFGLVPFFCPDWLAWIGRFLEPMVETLPIIRNFLCGQVLIVATSAKVDE